MDAIKISDSTHGGAASFVPQDIRDQLAASNAKRALNRSGISPLDTRVLVQTDDAETVTKGGIIKPQMLTQKEDWAQTRATLIEAGANAFMDWGDEARKPLPGDRVIIAQYAGSTATHDGADGQKYRICKDEDVLAVLGGEK